MKTAMRKLEEKLKDNLKWIVLNADYELMDKLFKEGLEKEKEQIKDAYHKGGYLLTKKPYGVFVEEVEEYYNQTYNQDRELSKDVKDILDNYNHNK